MRLLFPSSQDKRKTAIFSEHYETQRKEKSQYETQRMDKIFENGKRRISCFGTSLSLSGYVLEGESAAKCRVLCNNIVIFFQVS